MKRCVFNPGNLDCWKSNQVSKGRGDQRGPRPVAVGMPLNREREAGTDRRVHDRDRRHSAARWPWLFACEHQRPPLRSRRTHPRTWTSVRASTRLN